MQNINERHDQMKMLKVKRYSSLEQVISELYTGRHLPYGITKYYLLPDTSEPAA